MVSFFHQLHCLGQINQKFVDLLNNRTLVLTEIDHVEHCINYIRQGIMCSGDITLEGLDPEPEEGQSIIRGWDREHVCRNWNEIEKWMHENRAV
jgi:hypothetical protein